MKENILEIRPTQMALGMKEVEARIEKLNSMKAGELEDYLKSRKVPIVIGPKSRKYMVDHHHLVRACWETGIKEIHGEEKADFSNLSMTGFWKEMRGAHWIFTYDQLGNGPHDPVHLPENIKGLADDPYRSVAWKVRDEGGFEKTAAVPFFEFHWATFFRKNLKTHPVFDDFNKAVKEALDLARSPAAGHLPGYLAKNK